jgi:ferrous-iron efflux pump FieF
MRRAALLSLSMAAILLLLKAYAWWQVGSVSILSSLIDSALDVGASSVNLLAIRHALQPADREHRFGHGKAEPIAGLVQVTLILGSSLYLLYEVIHHFLHPQGLAHIQAGFVVLLLSVAATALVVGYQRYVIRRTGSVAIRADAAHYAGDFAVNLGAIFALIAVDALHLWWADPAIGLLTAGFIAYTALGIGRVALDMLMDREMSDDARRRIKEIVLAHKEVQAIHDLRTREAGQDCFIQFHLELDGSISLHEAHRISDEVEQDLRQAFPGAEFLIHQDPAGQERSTRRFA